jgi:hypothetical protein
MRYYKKIVFLIVFELLFLGACSSKNFIAISEGRFFPKEPNFTLINNKSYIHSGIDFDAIYYNQRKRILNNILYVSYAYYRFWPNGQVLRKSSSQLPTRELAEDFTKAIIGYYTILGSDIIIESFSRSPGSWNSYEYGKAYGKLENNELITFKSVYKSEICKYEMVYKKLNLGELKKQPDW